MKVENGSLDINFANVKFIFQKEFRTYFDSAIAYVLIVVFLGLMSWFYVSNIFLIGLASMRSMFELTPIIFLFFAPAITMRLLSEEKKSGTLEFLTTRPVGDWDIVLGKFFAAWALVGMALVPTLLYLISIASIGDIDIGPVIGSYIGLLLMAAVYIGVGIFASSLTKNQIIAFIIGFLIMLVLYFLDKILIYLPIWMSSTIQYAGIDYHFSNIAKGVIDTRNIVYFLSLILFSLYLTVVSLERRKR